MKKEQNFLVNSFLQNGIISKEDIEIYQFGIECFVLKFVNCLSYIIIGFLMKMPLELFLMGGILIPLRRSAGGYHAKTRAGCYLFSCIVVTLALSLCRIQFVHYIWYAMLFIADLFIMLLAPVDNENKIMDTSEKAHFRKKTMKLLIITNILCSVGILIKNRQLFVPMIMGIVVSAFLVVLGKYKNRILKQK